MRTTQAVGEPHSKPHPVVYRPLQARFLTIPQTPLCYWLRARFFGLLAGRTLGDVADVCQGLATADDARFVRFTWEVPPDEWAGPARRRRWVPFEKGGGYGKWFGHQFWVVDWEREGARIKATPGPRVQNEQHYFKEGWTYSSLARGSVGARHLAASLWGAVLADAIIPTSKLPLGCVANGRVASASVRWLRSSMVLSGSYVSRIPLPARLPGSLPALESACIDLKRWIVSWDPTERSFDLARFTPPRQEPGT